MLWESGFMCFVLCGPSKFSLGLGWYEADV